jgi:hypothetical protein
VNFVLEKRFALEQLQQAFAMKPEADIAAHVGEVLWVMNRQSEAEAIWRQGQKLDATTQHLRKHLNALSLIGLEMIKQLKVLGMVVSQSKLLA